VRRGRFKRRLFWTGVIFALMLIWLTVQVMRAAGAIASAARRPFRVGWKRTQVPRRRRHGREAAERPV
jgi:hypothetical protein